MGIERQPGRAPEWLAAVAVGVTLFSGAMILWGSHHSIPDDVYFYLKIADAIAEGRGSTFDGLRPTNGYHPLWMALCVVLRVAVGEQPPSVAIVAHLALSVLGTLAAVLLALRLSSRAFPSTLPVAPLMIAFYAGANAYGSELHVSLPLLVAAVAAALATARGDDLILRSAVVLGALLGAAALARLDNVFFCLGIGCGTALALKGRTLKTRLLFVLVVGATAAVLLGPYLAWNLHSFGRLVPISGALKAGLGHEVGPGIAKLGSQGLALVLGSLACVPALLWVRRSVPCAGVWVGAALGAAAHALYVWGTMDQVWTWYFASELVVVSLVAQLALASLPSRYARRAALLIAAAAIVGVSGATVRRYHARRAVPRPWYLDAARWLDRNVPEGQAVATTCSPGSLAFFSSRSIFALDGLTGDFRFHERAADVGLAGALDELGVTYVLSMGPRSGELGGYLATQARRGHGGEGPMFFGEPLSDGSFRATAVGAYSGILHRPLGMIELRPDMLVGEDFCERQLGVWRIPAAVQP